MDKIDPANQIGIILDLTTAMTAYVMAKACSENEIRAFFLVNKERLEDQGFKTNDIDLLSDHMKEATIGLKKGITKFNDEQE